MNDARWEGGFEVLGEDDNRVLSRGWRRGDDGNRRAVLVALPTSEHPSPSTLDRFAHEFELKLELDGAWAAQPIELSYEGGCPVLVLEDAGGEPLDRLLDAPMDVGRSLRVAIGIAMALGHVHARGLVHKDVKPANILVNGATDEVRLTGFGIASRLARQRPASEPPDFLRGTLAYMAPEQTGRMNRSIDARSDLYAVGVTLYEMLTGALPFTATDPIEWVHCHVAMRPPSPADRASGIPEAVCEIVMKLLAKTGEHRYQTAVGLAHDLRRCFAEWERHGRIEPLALGERDRPDRLMIPEKLYGRERDVESLLAAFDRVAESGATELALVSGYSGIGKSSVVNDLRKALAQRRGIFASGKFDQLKRDIPYSTLAQAFASLVRSLLGKNDAELARWRRALLEALGPNGSLMTDIIPELKFVIGDHPPVHELEPQQTQARFQLVFRRFISVFARPEHPLTLFLDDLQWLDGATLDLIEDLLTQADVQSLLLVGAYRDNEVDAAHPLTRKLDAVRTAGGKVAEILLAPLTSEHLGQLIANALRCGLERAEPLARLAHEKTGGNPFFAIQFITALEEDGLLVFDPAVAVWRWDIDRIRARSYTENVADLLVEKMMRLSVCSQEAMKQLACLGNVADVGTLALINEQTDDVAHAAMRDAVYAGLVMRRESAYKFLHDRIQQAAYSLIPEESRADLHLRIGRAMLTRVAPDHPAEHIYEVANQFNRGAARLIDRDEKVRVAAIDLRAGRGAKASAAPASACVYLAAGMALLDERDWDAQYELTFNLWLERAECEVLSGGLETAEPLIAELLRRAASKVYHAAACRLKILLHMVRSENAKAVNSALMCLRLFDINLPAHPTEKETHAEYEMVRRSLDGRSIESLINLPSTTDPAMRVAMQLLSDLVQHAYYTDFRLCCSLIYRMVTISVRDGICEAAVPAFGRYGGILGTVFHSYKEGFRFAKLSCDLVDKHGLVASRALVNMSAGNAAPWTQPIATAIGFWRATIRAAIETGDLVRACWGMDHCITYLLLRNDPLDAVWREAEKSIQFVKKARFEDVAVAIVSQQRFIAAMQGRTSTLSTFSDAQFDEEDFETKLTVNRTPTTIWLYWVLKLKARFLSGDYAEAFVSAEKARALLWASFIEVQRLDYFYYAALTAAACYEGAPPNQRHELREVLLTHQEQLREWAESYTPTFADKHALVSAEIARVEGRDAEAMLLYEKAIQSARENAFVQNEGLAHELAARFYAARGVPKIARVYLMDARHCYLQWGALGKVRQLEGCFPHLHEETTSTSRAAPIGAPEAQLDVATAVKASQAVSGEILLENLIKTLMVIAVEHAGAERGLLILPQGDELWLEAEAITGRDAVNVDLRHKLVTPSDLPLTILQYVIRTHELVISDDASGETPFSADEYVASKRVRSVLCMPLIKQTKLVGALYIENNVATSVFAPARIAVLKLLASQAAISLENSRLYRDLENREAKIRRLVDSNILGVYIWNLDGTVAVANDAFLSMLEYDREDLLSGRMRWTDLTPPEQREHDERDIAELRTSGAVQPYEVAFLSKNGSRVPTLTGGALFEEGGNQGVSFVLDLTERKRTEEARRSLELELAHMNRLSVMGELAASLAHEITQPIGSARNNARAALNFLDKQPPNLGEVKEALGCIVDDADRAGNIIDRIRDHIKKAPPRKHRFDLNEAINEVIMLARSAIAKNGVAVRTCFMEGSASVEGDRVQIQQVVLNLVLNAVEAMIAVEEGARKLLLTTERNDSLGFLVAVGDSGPGIDPERREHVFEAFYTTKSSGVGMGLSICRSIIGAHGGRLWADENTPHGSVFQFTLRSAEGIS